MMDATRSETALQDLETTTWAENHCRGWQSYVLERDLGVACIFELDLAVSPHGKFAHREEHRHSHRQLTCVRWLCQEYLPGPESYCDD